MKNLTKLLGSTVFVTVLVFSVAALSLIGCGENPGGGTNSDINTTINIAAIVGVTVPTQGATPVNTITANGQYTGTVVWNSTPATFAYETIYTATITLTAKSGYTLVGVKENFFSVAGATSVSNAANSGIVTAVFPQTGQHPPAVINIAAIVGLTVPVQGATPITAITENDQYTGTIAWYNPENTTFTTFTYDTVYTATITLIAKSGYTLVGVKENFFSVAGATSVSNAANSGIVTVVFPQTEDDPTLLHLLGNITISPNADVTTGMQLTATYSGSETVSYQWEKNGTNIDGETDKTYTPTEPGFYTITVNATGYNNKTSDSVTVTLPNLSGSITISPNTDVTTYTELTATYTGSETVTYYWKKDDNTVSINSNRYTPSEAGNYTVTVSATGYNNKTSNPVTVALSGLSGDITISPNTDVKTGTELTATYTGGETVTYHWKKDDNTVSINSNRYTPSEAGSYTVTVSATGYDNKTSNTVIVTTCTVTFISNGGSTVSQITGLSRGATITRPANPTKYDSTNTVYIFAGWYKEVELTNAWNFTSDIVTKDQMLYAKWTEKTTFAIGDTGPGGGKIFFVSQTGFLVYQNATDSTGITCYYLEAAPSAVTNFAAWASSSYTGIDIPGTTGSGTYVNGVAYGKKNTALILATDANAPAAKACRDYSNNGKSDWYLASKDELCERYHNLGAESLNSSGWWSSSQCSFRAAWCQTVYDGQWGEVTKSTSRGVLPVRAF